MPEKPTLGTALILPALERFFSGFSFPSDEECRQLADELQDSPPPELTPEALSLVLQILRGDGFLNKL